MPSPWSLAGEPGAEGEPWSLWGGGRTAVARGALRLAQVQAHGQQGPESPSSGQAPALQP